MTKISEMRIMKVRHKESGLFYILFEGTAGVYIAANDGVVPSGQLLGSETLEEALKDNPFLEEVKE